MPESVEPPGYVLINYRALKNIQELMLKDFPLLNFLVAMVFFKPICFEHTVVAR